MTSRPVTQRAQALIDLAVDAEALGSGRGGDETSLGAMLRGLAAVAGPGDRIQVLLPHDVPGGAYGGLDVQRVPRRRGATRFAAALPLALRRLEPRPSLVLTLTHAPLVLPEGVRSVLLLPDLSFEHHPEFFPRSTRVRLRSLVPRQARRAALVLTVSEFSKRDLVARYGLDPSRVAVVPNAVLPAPRLTALQQTRADQWLSRHGVRAPFLLYLGNVHARKNVDRLVDAFAVARGASSTLGGHQLVIAGAHWFGQGQIPSSPGVVSLGPVDDHVRERLFQRAGALVYPSLFEGFGLPPLEAMARGVAVVASSAAAIPEVVGDAALLVSPHSTDEIADALIRVVEDDDLRADLHRLGPVRAAEFTIDRTGRALADALRAVGSARR